MLLELGFLQLFRTRANGTRFYAHVLGILIASEIRGIPCTNDVAQQIANRGIYRGSFARFLEQVAKIILVITDLKINGTVVTL